MTDASLQKIAATYGTPTFVFDTDALQARVRAIQAIWGREIDLCYSIKANPFLLPAMMQVTARLEVCSPGELSLCESLHAADARVIYSGVNKTPVDIARAVADGVGTCTAESLLQVRYLQDAARKAAKRLPVVLRLNAGSQFGMSKEDLFTALAHRRETPDLEFIGIHYFVGTQRKKLVNQQKELAMLRELYAEIEHTFGLRLPELEYGPGLAVPYFDGDDFADTLSPAKDLAQALHEVSSWVHLTVEMGRFYTAECGYYLTTAMDCKDPRRAALLHCGRRNEPPELSWPDHGYETPASAPFCCAGSFRTGLDTLRQPLYYERCSCAQYAAGRTMPRRPACF